MKQMETEILENKIIVKNCYEFKDYIKEIPGRMWDPARKYWTIPVSIKAIDMLKDISAIDKKIMDRYKELKQNQMESIDIKLAEDIVPVEPMPIKLKPFQHQVKAYNLAILNSNYAFLMEMGTGKSLASVAVASRRYLRGEVKRLLIIAPASVLPVWQKEFEASKVMYKVVTLEGAITKRIKDLNELSGWQNHLQVAVINYEATWRMLDTLMAWTPDMIVCDESQRIKTHNSKQSKAVHQLGKIAKYKLILTGTPVQNSPLDFFSEYKFLDPSIFGTSYYAFRARYAVMGGYGQHQVIRYQHLDELIKKAHSIAFRVTKEEALDLPEQIDEFRYCELEPSAQKIYDEILRESYTELEHGEVTVKNVLTKLLRLQQITGGFIRDDGNMESCISKAKLSTLKEIVEDLVETNKKVVIFARFLSEITAIRKLAEKMNLQYSLIAGEVKMSERGNEVKKFQEDENVKVFIGQIDTAGTGLTLTAADTTIYYSLNFNYGTFDQSKSRTHRIGQKNNCTYIYLLAKHTVDEKILKALQKKEGMAKEVVDNWRYYISKN